MIWPALTDNFKRRLSLSEKDMPEGKEIFQYLEADEEEGMPTLYSSGK